MKKYFKLFSIFFRIGAFTFGGGYAMIPLIEEEMVRKQGFIDENEFLDIIAVSQSLPGALAINSSTFVGYKLYGVLGAFIACLGVALPSLIIITSIASFLIANQDSETLAKIFKGIRPAVASLIVLAVLKLKKGVKKNSVSFFIFIGALISVLFLNIHPIIIIVSSGGLASFIYRNEEVA